MNKALELPHKVDGQLMEIMVRHLTGDKKDADPTDLSFFNKADDGSYELNPSVVSENLRYNPISKKLQ